MPGQQTFSGQSYNNQPMPPTFFGGPFSLSDLLLSPNNKYKSVHRQSGASINAGQTVPSTRTFHIVGTDEQEWDSVQLAILSCDTANTVQGLSACFAPTANAAVINTPSGGLGAFQNFTWTGAGSVNVTPASIANQYAITLSDVMSGAGWSSIPRNDSPAFNLPMWMLRIELPVGPGTYVYTNEATSSVAFNTAALTRGRTLTKLFQPGVAGVTTPAAFTSTTDGNVSVAFALIFRSRGRVVKVAGYGDSIMGGSLSTSNALPSLFLSAIELSTTQWPVKFFNGGFSGQTSALALANAEILLASALKPDVAFYSPYSPNDGALNATRVATTIRQANRFCQVARTNGVIPVITTPTPDNTESLAISQFKLQLWDEFLLWAQRGILVADWWGSVAEFPGSNTSTGWGWVRNTNGDNIHPNDAGENLLEQANNAVLLSILSANRFAAL